MMRRTMVASQEAKQALTELSGSMGKHVSGPKRLVVRDHLNMHASMLRRNLHHNVFMFVFGLTGFTQVIIITHSALEARTMEVTNAATITNDTSVTQSTRTIGSSKTATATTIATIFIHHHHDASRHLVGTVDLNHGVRLLGTGLTRGTQVVVITNRALEARSS
jgi:hypothetical protein